MSKKKNLVKNTLIILLGKISTQFISFLLLPLYTAFLTTSDYGFVDLVTSYIILLVPLITLELEMSVFRYLIDARKDKEKTRAIISNNFNTLFKCLLLFSVFYIILGCFIDIPFKWLILLDVVVCVISGNLLQVVRGLGDVIGFSISCFITGVITVILNIYLIAFLKLGAYGMLLSIILANLIGFIYLIFRCRLWKYYSFSLKDKSLVKSMRKYGLPLVPNSVSWWIVNISDRTIITMVLGASFNGIYAVSNKFPAIISGLLGVFNLSWSESAALYINSSDKDTYFKEVLNDVFRLFSCLCLGMIATLPFIFTLLINKEFADAYLYIPILIIAALFNCLICIYTGIYIAKKDTKKVASTTIIGAVINILINILFIKFIGLYAASISTAISYFVMTIYRHRDLNKEMNLSFDKGIISKVVFLFIVVLFSYYYNNLYLNIIILLLVIIFTYILNKNIVHKGLTIILKKLSFK